MAKIITLIGHRVDALTVSTSVGSSWCKETLFPLLFYFGSWLSLTDDANVSRFRDSSAFRSQFLFPVARALALELLHEAALEAQYLAAGTGHGGYLRKILSSCLRDLSEGSRQDLRNLFARLHESEKQKLLIAPVEIQESTNLALLTAFHSIDYKCPATASVYCHHEHARVVVELFRTTQSPLLKCAALDAIRELAFHYKYREREETAANQWEPEDPTEREAFFKATECLRSEYFPMIFRAMQDDNEFVKRKALRVYAEKRSLHRVVMNGNELDRARQIVLAKAILSLLPVVEPEHARMIEMRLKKLPADISALRAIWFRIAIFAGDHGLVSRRQQLDLSALRNDAPIAELLLRTMLLLT